MIPSRAKGYISLCQDRVRVKVGVRVTELELRTHKLLSIHTTV